MKQARILNDQELEELLTFISTTKSPVRNRTIMLLTHYAGMTPGEVANLKIQHVSNSNGSVVSESTIGEGNDQRVVLFSEKMQTELRLYLQTIDVSNKLAPLFSTQRRDGFSPSSLSQILNGIYKNAGFKGCTSHSGRRGFLTKLYEQGISTNVIMKLAGHKNRQTTLQYSVKNKSEDVLRNAVELLK